MKFAIVFFALLVMVAAFEPSVGSMPRMISYQGVLKDAEGNVLTGTHALTLRIYDAEIGGSEVWSDAMELEISNGLFTAILGSSPAAPLNLAFDVPYWLGLSVDGEDELEPRLTLAAAPYAFTAASLEPDVVSSVDGVANDEGDIDLIAGENITITPDDVSNTITIATTGGGGTLDDAYDFGGPGAGRTITVDAGGVVLDATGIGAGNPGLVIEGNNTYEPALRLAWEGVTSYSLHNNNGDFMISKHLAGTNTPFRILSDAGTGQLTVASTGVGVGAAEPIERLQVVGAINLGTTANANEGTIRWTGSDFEGYAGGAWQTLTASGAGADDDWVIAGDDIYHIDGSVGIGALPMARSRALEEDVSPLAEFGRGDSKLYVLSNNSWGVVGELSETDAAMDGRAGVFGLRSPGTDNPGFGYGFGMANAGAIGFNMEPGQHTFGVAGHTVSNSVSGGVLGSESDGSPWGALGYRDEILRPWGVYTPDNIYTGGSIVMPTGAGEGYVLTSDADGTGTWQPSTGWISGSGTTNYIPKFTNPNAVGSSIMYEEFGTVKIAASKADRETESAPKGDNDHERDRLLSKLDIRGNDGWSIYARVADTDGSDGEAAVYGYRSDSNAGTGYAVGQINTAVKGYSYYGDRYTFGVAGYTWGDSTRCGGVLGASYEGSTWGALGYKDENSKWWGVYTPDDAHVGGNVAIGTTSSSSKLAVSGGNGSVDLLIEADADNNGEEDQPSLTMSQDGGYVEGQLGFFDGDDEFTLANRSLYGGLRLETFGGGMTVDIQGNVGIGVEGDVGHRLHVVTWRQASDGWAGRFENGHPNGVGLITEVESTNLALLASQNGSGDIFRCDGPTGTVFRVENDGWTVCSVLEITGGSDLAEPFQVSGSEEIEPGMVVCIDASQPGQLRLSDRPYDRTVAGIVSGANDLSPGLVMAQVGGKVDGTHPVALTGRAYCLADAGSGSIEPGDLLTTSGVDGHAMKATDAERSQGAIIGKAMTSLERGRGLVLVLVSLQ